MGAEQWYVRLRVCIAVGKTKGKETEYTDRAMEFLQRAVKVGYKDVDRLKRDPELGPLRDRDDFRKLLADLEKKSAPKAKPAPRFAARLAGPCSLVLISDERWTL